MTSQELIISRKEHWRIIQSRAERLAWIAADAANADHDLEAFNHCTDIHNKVAQALRSMQKELLDAPQKREE
jgi:hypothetical protein